MFNFLGMAGNYEARKVDRYDADWGYISTASVNDAGKPYETAVAHREYNAGKLVIVEAYDTKAEALEGHARWVETMTSEPLPDQLIDRGLSGISQVIDALESEEWRSFKRCGPGQGEE